MNTLANGAAAFFRAAFRASVSAQLWCFLLVLGGAGILLSGLYLLAGLACVLIAGGIIGMGLGFFVMIGMTRA